MLFKAWGLATAVVAFVFPLSTPKIRELCPFDLSPDLLPDYSLMDFFQVPKRPPNEKDALIPLALPRSGGLGQLDEWLFYPLKKATHTSSFWSEEEPLRFECYGGLFFLWLLEILPFSLPFVLRLKGWLWALTNTQLSENVLLIYHSTFFLLQTNWSVFLASGLWNRGRKYKKSFPAIGRDGRVLSLSRPEEACSCSSIRDGAGSPHTWREEERGVPWY